MPPAASATDFPTAIDGTLHWAVELARRLIGAHQAVASLIIAGNWKGMRKYFSLSPKYAAWYSYRTPAVGFGLHAKVVAHNSALRFTQTELEQHPAWKHFGVVAGKHPPTAGSLFPSLERMAAIMACCNSPTNTTTPTLPSRTKRN